MRTGARADNFPIGKMLGQGAIVPCVLPFRTLEPSAKRLADAAAACWPGMHGAELEQTAEQEIWWPLRPARSAVLAHEPCQLSELISFGNYIGLDAALHPELMWLVNCAITPELPVGWLHRNTADGSAFYWNVVLGVAQWEHPAVSYYCGVARRLTQGKVPDVRETRRRGRRNSAAEAARQRDERITDALEEKARARGEAPAD